MSLLFCLLFFLFLSLSVYLSLSPSLSICLFLPLYLPISPPPHLYLFLPLDFFPDSFSSTLSLSLSLSYSCSLYSLFIQNHRYATLPFHFFYTSSPLLNSFQFFLSFLVFLTFVHKNIYYYQRHFPHLPKSFEVDRPMSTAWIQRSSACTVRPVRSYKPAKNLTRSEVREIDPIILFFFSFKLLLMLLI